MDLHIFNYTYIDELRYRRNYSPDESVRRLSTEDDLRNGDPTPDLTTYGGIKLGWVQGVLIPCLLNIWGVMLFLRIAWIVGQAGIGCTIVIIFLSSIVCIITTLSLSAICTNGDLQGGGVYFIVSRSLGAELGASVGIIFAFANAVAASMNTIGFCESLNDLLKYHNMKIIDNGVNDTRIIGTIALFIMCLICAFGMDWETKTQNFLIVIIVCAIINYIIGAAVGPYNDKARAQGFVGVSVSVAWANWPPDFRYSEGEHHNFVSVFAMYFPAVTGVQAGANICGDLKDPATAIPRGTLLALAISITSYLMMSFLSGMGALRDASGNITHVGTDAISNCTPNCSYGLHNNYEIMQLMALWGPLIYAGCWAATLSTALTNLLSVPRLIQALGVDHIYPGLIFFSKPYGKHGEPYRGYVLVFVVSLLFLLIANLNAIAPLITNFYLASYALINFCTFHGAFFKPISWRPSFRYYNLWLSLAGCIMCLIIMTIISWIMALVTTFVFLFLYLIVLYRKPGKSWGSSSDAQHYQDTIGKILQMSSMSTSAKSFNPQLLMLAGKPYAREWLFDMGKIITAVGSFMIVADIQKEKMTPTERQVRIDVGEGWVKKHKARAFYVLLHSLDLEQGLMALLQCSGLGRLAPNILLVGYMYRWRRPPYEKARTYFRWVQMAFEQGLAVAIFRVSSSFRPPTRGLLETMRTSNLNITMNTSVAMTKSRMQAIMPEDSDTETDKLQGRSDEPAEEQDEEEQVPIEDEKSTLPLREHSSSADLDIKIGNIKPLVFHQKSILDAWWLYDDGGMNILLPYIIAHRGKPKEKMILRIFVLPRSGLRMKESYAYMERVLAKLRIEYAHLTLVEGINDDPNPATWTVFESLIKNHMSVDESDPCRISNAKYDQFLKKTTKHLRLRELLFQHSFPADLIVMTLPQPREDEPAALYMAWLEIMSRDMPPMMFIRGNQTAVFEA